MIRTRKGFTLIELVMVIVILGILAAVAIPRYIDMSTQAQDATAKGILGGVRAANAIIMSGQAVNSNTGTWTMGNIVGSANIGGVMSAINPLDFEYTVNNVIFTATMAATPGIQTPQNILSNKGASW